MSPVAPVETIPWGSELATLVHRFGPLPAVHDAQGSISFSQMAGRAARLAIMLRDAGMTGTAGTGAVAVISLPSEYWGEVIVAAAEIDDPAWQGRAEAALEALARYKRPRALLTLAELPRNAQGKVIQRAIREIVLERWRLVDGPYPRLEPAPGS